jgi:hypothetical protein
MEGLSRTQVLLGGTNILYTLAYNVLAGVLHQKRGYSLLVSEAGGELRWKVTSYRFLYF